MSNSVEYSHHVEIIWNKAVQTKMVKTIEEYI